MTAQPHRGESGSILIIILVFTAALLIAGGALTIIVFTESRIAHNQERDAKLYYITEAGIDAGVAALGCRYDYDGPASGGLGGGNFQVEIVKEPGLPKTHTYYGRLPQRIAAGQRLLISRGELEGESMIVAVIVEQRGALAGDVPPVDSGGRPQAHGAEGVVIIEWIGLWRI